jgi:hypothetical protein
MEITQIRKHDHNPNLWWVEHHAVPGILPCSSSIIACASSSFSARNANPASSPIQATYVFIVDFLSGGLDCCKL